VWGDPHILSFDEKTTYSKKSGMFKFNAKSYAAGDWKLYEDGDSLAVQGRFKPLPVDCVSSIPPSSMVALAISGSHACNYEITVNLDNVHVSKGGKTETVQYGGHYVVAGCFEITGNDLNNDFTMTFASTATSILVYEEVKNNLNRLAMEIVEVESNVKNVGGLCSGKNIYNNKWQVSKDERLFKGPMASNSAEALLCEGEALARANKYCVDEGFNGTEWLREFVFTGCVIDKCACLEDELGFETAADAAVGHSKIHPR